MHSAVCMCAVFSNVPASHSEWISMHSSNSSTTKIRHWLRCVALHGNRIVWWIRVGCTCALDNVYLFILAIILVEFTTHSHTKHIHSFTHSCPVQAVHVSICLYFFLIPPPLHPSRHPLTHSNIMKREKLLTYSLLQTTCKCTYGRGRLRQ